jgi:hypothetical protein
MLLHGTGEGRGQHLPVCLKLSDFLPPRLTSRARGIIFVGFNGVVIYRHPQYTLSRPLIYHHTVTDTLQYYHSM